MHQGANRAMSIISQVSEKQEILYQKNAAFSVTQHSMVQRHYNIKRCSSNVFSPVSIPIPKLCVSADTKC